MDPVIILTCCVLFALLLYFVLKSIQYKVDIDTWKEISKMKDELIGHLRNKNSIQEDIINAYKNIAKYDQSMIDLQKNYIDELFEMLKQTK